VESGTLNDVVYLHLLELVEPKYMISCALSRWNLVSCGC